MRSFALSAAALSLLASSVEAYYPITQNVGDLDASSGERPDRLEINDLVANGGAQLDLFLLCMADIQARPQSQIDSWYQIAGIHGRPYTSWDSRTQGPQRAGYCPHSSVLFPTWHRPYVQLLEQNIWQCAQTRAQQYKGNLKSTYVNAAQSLRLPFWDWMKSAALPPIVTQTKVTITDSTGKKTIDNPLYQYTFKSGAGPGSNDFPNSSGRNAKSPQKFQSTLRTPTSRGVSNHAAVNAALAQQAGYLHDQTYLILTQTTNYGEFSNNGYPGTQTGYGSLENPHGTIHNAVGGNGGHMSYLDYAGFDPIFWLHHCNVDRLYAIWQAVNPGYKYVNQNEGQGTYAIASGTLETENTQLSPFSTNIAGTLYSNKIVRSTGSFGYTYPEIRDWNKTADQNAADVRQAIRDLYDPDGQFDPQSEDGSDNGSQDDDNNNNKRRNKYPRDTAPIDPSKALVGGKYRNWALNLQLNKFALDRSFNIYLFMGTPSNDSSTWIIDPTLIGTYPVLQPADSNNMASDVTVYGTMPFTRSMLKAVDGGALANLEPAEATPFLQKHLQWRLADLGGVQVPVSSVPSLKVFVVDQVVTPPTNPSDFPDYGVVTPHLNVTEGKAGSVVPGDGVLAHQGFPGDYKSKTKFVKSTKPTYENL